MAGDPGQARTGMDDFRDVVNEFRGTLLLAVGGSALLPVAAAMADLAPPWPRGVTLISSVMILVVLIFVFQFLWKAKRAWVNRTMVAGLLLFLGSGGGYFALFDTFTFRIPTTGEQIVVGCGWTSNARRIAEEFEADPTDGCPGNYRHLLSAAEYETSEIWRSGSLTRNRMMLFGTWLGLLVGLALIVAAFVTYRIRQPSHRSGRRSKVPAQEELDKAE